jgi:hypothetical protein
MQLSFFRDRNSRAMRADPGSLHGLGAHGGFPQQHDEVGRFMARQVMRYESALMTALMTAFKSALTASFESALIACT